ncbi:hypothetical protein [Pseudomonas sp. GL-B-19]|uniref:hypothetical protein n=1 Tax=Pseudomonas sp. GL-B-19 TaxID=2832393 RepID=UPI001CBF5F36|nr:hypothetical protein [Pseudomonas sp. GL-B-19]
MDKADIRQIAGRGLVDGRKSATLLQAMDDKNNPVTLGVKRLAGSFRKVARALRYNQQMPAVAQLDKTNPSRSRRVRN